jgi:hypothetical protein
MSPRYKPSHQEESSPAVQVLPRDVAVREREDDRRYLDALQHERNNPYGGGRHSYFRDLLAVATAQARRDGTFQQPRYARGEAPGPPPEWAMPTEEEALARINAWGRRDLSGGSVPDLLRPDMPLAGVFGQAARQTGKLASAFDRLALTRGMVDVSGGVPVVSIPRLATGAAVGTGAENSAVTDLDPTSASANSAVGTVSGLVDLSYQLADFSRPTAMDQVIADDLGRAFGSALDVQLLSGSGASGQTKGFLNWAGILSVTGSVSSAEAFAESLWKAYSQLAGAPASARPTRRST